MCVQQTPGQGWEGRAIETDRKFEALIERMGKMDEHLVALVDEHWSSRRAKRTSKKNEEKPEKEGLASMELKLV